MTGRAILLASAAMAASGLWTACASAAPIRADMSLQNNAVFEQVQMREGGRGGGGIGGGAAFSRGGGSIGGSAAMSRGAGPAFNGAAINRGAGSNFTGNRVVQGGNWDGRRFSDDGRRFNDGRFRRGFRGPGFAFGFGPAYYDYGYYPYDDYGYYDDYAYGGNNYVAVAPGGAGGDVAYCESRFRSYDPSTGTYLGYDGLRHPCP
jgi:hypothetical protein